MGTFRPLGSICWTCCHSSLPDASSSPRHVNSLHPAAGGSRSAGSNLPLTSRRARPPPPAPAAPHSPCPWPPAAAGSHAPGRLLLLLLLCRQEVQAGQQGQAARALSQGQLTQAHHQEPVRQQQGDTSRHVTPRHLADSEHCKSESRRAPNTPQGHCFNVPPTLTRCPASAKASQHHLWQLPLWSAPTTRRNIPAAASACIASPCHVGVSRPGAIRN